MSSSQLNHFMLPVDDIDESADFIERVLGLERTPAIEAEAPQAWFQVGSVQLHLVEREADQPYLNHIAFHVDDFVDVYEKVKELDAIDPEPFGAPMYVFPDGSVQMYFREPSGNLLEADWPDISTLPEEIQNVATTRKDVFGVEDTSGVSLYDER
ncbi:VOC family protein (plasmid) [Haloferax prahovense]|uniref:VOC family protein n=1 Tax=Haloferax prahovense TaxID=381852 RepID=UPI003C74C3C7